MKTPMNTQNTQECKVKHWSVRTVSGFAGGALFEDELFNAQVNLTVCTNSDTVEEVRKRVEAMPDLLSACQMTLQIFKEYEDAHECINYADAERIMRRCRDAIQKAGAK